MCECEQDLAADCNNWQGLDFGEDTMLVMQLVNSPCSSASLLHIRLIQHVKSRCLSWLCVCVCVCVYVCVRGYQARHAAKLVNSPCSSASLLHIRL